MADLAPFLAPIGLALAVALLVQFAKLLAGAAVPKWRNGPWRRTAFRALALALGALGGLTLPADLVPGLHPALLGLVCGGLSEFVYRAVKPRLSATLQGRTDA